MAWLAPASLAMIANGCTVADAARGPRLDVTATPPEAVLLVDGSRTRHPRELGFAYYGTRALRALPAATLEATERFASADLMVDVPPPAPKWLFPLDFVIECALWPWTDVDDRSADVALAPNPDRVPDDTPPRGLEALRERAHAARASRW